MQPDANSRGEFDQLRRENEQLRKRLSQLGALGQRITSSLALSTALQDIVEAAADLVGARYGALAVFDESGRVRTFITHGVTAEQRERLGPLPRGLGLLGLLHQDQKTLRLSDLSTHPRSVGFPPNHPPMKSFLGAPIRLDSELLGSLYLTEKMDGIEFTAEDEDVLVLFASQAALAIRNAQQYEALEEERQRLESVVRLSPVGVLMIEAASEQVLMANREAERILDFSYRPGSTLADLRDVSGVSGLDETHPVWRALTMGEVVRAEEVVHTHADGWTVPTLISATPIYGEDGEISGAAAMIQDVSPQEELERLKSEFLAIVSHELRTPLTAIKGSAATVLGSPHGFDQKEILEFFSIVDEQADRMRDLISNLLDMTRIEVGTLSVTLSPFDLRESLETARETFARSGGRQDIFIEQPDFPVIVNADRRRIDQVLNNLLGNADKFSREDATVTIKAEIDGDRSIVRVIDQGRGLSPEDLPRIFRKFYQSQRDSGRHPRGSGLGLAICKGIVEAHGGRIWAFSEGEGQGATVCFTLPLSQKPEPGRVAEVSRETDHLGSVSQAGTKTRVLAVDDELQVLRYLQNTLRQAGYSPTVTADPAEVVALVEQEQPQVVLLDLMFPGIDGFEVLERIRQVSGVPVIILTARDSDEDTVRALRLGADDYITKPFSPSELLARIEACLRRRVLPDQIEVRPALTVEDMHVNYGARQVSLSGEAVSLTATEYKLLYELSINSGRVLTYEQILRRVWGPEYSGESQLVRAIVRNLRRKLGDDARNPRFIHTVPNVGYRMTGPATP